MWRNNAKKKFFFYDRAIKHYGEYEKVNITSGLLTEITFSLVMYHILCVCMCVCVCMIIKYRFLIKIVIPQCFMFICAVRVRARM